MKNLITKYIILLLVINFTQNQQVNSQNGQSNNYKLQTHKISGAAVAPADNAGSLNYNLQQGMISDLGNTKTQSGQYLHYPGIIFPDDSESSQYCTTNLYTSGCNSGDYIDDFILGNIENTNSGCSQNAYGDFTYLSTVLHPGIEYDFTIKCGYNNQYISIWIDLDDDFEFENNELLVTNLFIQQSDSGYVRQINIPENAPIGEHRMRLRSRWNNFSNQPCTEYEFGETEDYTVVFEDFTPGYCIDSLYIYGCTLGDYLNDFILEDISNTVTECSPNGYGDYTNFITDLTIGQQHEVTLSCGFNNQRAAIWIDLNDDYQFSDDEKLLGNFDLPQAFEQYQAQIIIPQDAQQGEHRLRIRTRYFSDPEDPCTQYSYGETEDYMVNLQPGVETYCVDNLYTTGCTMGDYIDEFILGDISNLNSGCSQSGYGNFTNLSTCLNLGETYTISMTCMYSNQHASLWIDLNQNFDFEISEKLVDNFILEQQGQQYQMEISIPEDATVGQYRMRIRTNYNSNPEDACEQYTYGEAEDYTVNIQEPIVSYCTENLYSSGCQSGDGFNDFIFADIENISSGCSNNGYGDFTNMIGTVNRGSEYTLSVSSFIGSQYVSIWVDTDEDFEFGENEIILNNGIIQNPGSADFTIIIPEYFPEGEFRMRARARYNDSVNDACEQYNYGEAEDYTLIVNPALPEYCTENLYSSGCQSGDGFNDFIFADIENISSGCSNNGYGDFTNMIGTVNRGSEYTLSVSSFIGSQYVSIWVDTDEDFEFGENEIILNNGIIQNPGSADFTIIIPEYFPEGEFRMRARARYNDSVNDACEQYNYGEAEDYTLIVNPALPEYCTENLYLSGCNAGDGLNDFILADIENTNSGCSENGYGDFTNLSTNIITGAEYPISFSSNYNSQFVTVWVDLDNSLSFEENEIVVNNLFLDYAYSTVSDIFSLPPETQEGSYRLRARTNFVYNVDDPCETYSYGEAEDYTINVIHPIAETQSIYLSEGWNSLSSYLEPTENNMEDIFLEIEDNLIIVQNMTDVYWPEQSINTFNNGWESNSGYQMKMSNDTWINIHGNQIVPPQVELNEGWNMMPVYSPCLVDPNEFFAPTLDNVFLVKDIAGTGVFWPEMNINTLQNMKPGKSYLALLEQAATLSFSSCNKSATTEIEIPDIPQFNGVTILTSPISHTIAFADKGEFNFNINDEIGAFTIDGVCAGAVQWDENNQIITIFGDDPTTLRKEGFGEGEQIYFSRISAHSGEITSVEFDFNTSYPQHNGNFHENGLSVISGITTTGIRYEGHPEISVYPNPVTDILHIKSNVNISRIEVINRQGIKAMESEIGNTTETELNIQQLSSGVYSLIIHSEKNITVQKIIKLR